MIRVSITRADATVTETETLTAGRVGLECAFTFSGEWEGLQKVAVFEGAETIEVALGTATVAVVPPECMATAGYNLRVGAYGLSTEEALVIPTVWAKAGKIKDSASPDEGSYNYATPELAAQIMEAAENAKNIAQGVAQAAENGDFNGADGVSPSATVTKSGDTATITITDADGTTTASVLDGTDGSAGYSPEVEIESITGGHSVTITDAEHPTGQTFNVMDGDESIKWATYGTTTSAQLESWYQAGYQICCIYSDRTYSFAYRTSSTKHTLSVIYANSCFALVCNSDSWSATTYALAQSSNVPAKATSTPSDLGTAAIGSSSKYAAENHVHKMPSASDVGAIAAPVSPSAGDVLTYSGGAWGAAAPASVPSAATNTPADLGTAAVGTSSKYAKEDHVHNKPSYSASDVGAIAAPVSPSDGDYLVYDSDTSAWVAQAGGGGSGLTNEIKDALLQLAEKVAYIDANGADYYGDLLDALYPLASISAVFTQGANVIYDTDSLDTLKSMLVVTATYDGGDTATISDYTLSGSLTAGTSTITVSYRDETDTFSVSVTTAAAPTGYTEYDYIKFTGTTSKYGSGVIIGSKSYANLNQISVEFDFKANVSTSDCVFGGRLQSGNTHSFAFYAASSSMAMHWHGWDNNVSGYVSNTVNHVKCVAKEQSPSIVTVNSTDTSVEWVNDNTLNTYISLFTNHNTSDVNTNYLKKNIEVGKIVVRDIYGKTTQTYIPCLRTNDNVIGLYDAVEGTFYTASTASYATQGNSGCVYALGNWS